MSKVLKRKAFRHPTWHRDNDDYGVQSVDSTNESTQERDGDKQNVEIDYFA